MHNRGLLTVELDDDKYSAHAGLLGRSIQSTASLQNVDKALSNPQAVIQDIAGSNGQNCFAYQGDCVNLNDNNAMAKACGSGNTPVGWDDAGCGNGNCVSVHNCLLLMYIRTARDSNYWSDNDDLALWETDLLSNEYCAEELHLARQQ